jgi:hypothetical protein
MNINIKRSLKSAFDPPPALHRDSFLASADFPRISRAGFLVSQLGYIRKRVWAAAFVVIGITLFGTHNAPFTGNLDLLGVVSSLLPFAALVVVTEIIRSQAYNMAELEMSCRYSLNQVVLARLGIIGAVSGVMAVTAAL